MKRIVLVLVTLASFSFSGCFKDDRGCSYSDSNVTAPANEVTQIEEYLAANNITTAVKHSSGMYYEILQAGSNGKPGLCSSVQINYVGKLTNGNTFDSNSNAQFTLGVLIEGWKKGLPLIQKAGRIKLYIPPTLGYGSKDITDRDNNIIIPGNSMLIFDITLINFQ